MCARLQAKQQEQHRQQQQQQQQEGGQQQPGGKRAAPPTANGQPLAKRLRGGSEPVARQPAKGSSSSDGQPEVRHLKMENLVDTDEENLKLVE